MIQGLKMHPTKKKIFFAPSHSVSKSPDHNKFNNNLKQKITTKLQQGKKQAKQDTNQNEIHVTSGIVIHLF